MAIENEDSLAIREIVMADLEEIPKKAKVARESLGIYFPEYFVDRLIAIKMENNDRRRCNNKNCNLVMDRISWKNFLSDGEYRCPDCHQKQIKLLDGRHDPPWIFAKMHEVCESSTPKFKLGMSAMEKADDNFSSVTRIMHKVQADLGRFVMEGGEIPDKDE